MTTTSEMSNLRFFEGGEIDSRRVLDRAAELLESADELVSDPLTLQDIGCAYPRLLVAHATALIQLSEALNAAGR